MGRIGVDHGKDQQGQVTVPKRVRTRLAVGPGDRLAFEFDEHERLHVTPVSATMPPLRGFLAEAASGRRLDGRQIDEAIRQRMRRKYQTS